MKLTFKNVIGKRILVGLTYLDDDNSVKDKVQFHGIIVKAGNSEGIVITRADNDHEFTLPPDLSAIQKANKGEYRLHSTGEIVVNPDFITTWTIHPPKRTE